MGLVNFGVPRELVLAARQRFKIRNFVETGTFRGDTAHFAAQYFDQVVTIEFDPKRFIECKRRFAGMPRVTCLLANSPTALRLLIPELKGPTLYWLDAHWNGDAKSRQYECPVMEEVAAINEIKHEAYILVDDARYFIAPPPPPCDIDAWPSVAELTGNLAHGGRYVAMVDDAILAFPAGAKEFMVEYIRGRPMAWSGAGGGAPKVMPVKVAEVGKVITGEAVKGAAVVKGTRPMFMVSRNRKR
ncbi:MAG TPA: hypothetical protein VGN88_02595 [Phycisphaerae bacterium]